MTPSPIAVGSCPTPQGPNLIRAANLITAEELTEVADRSVFEAIQNLRPRWLSRTAFRSDSPAVIVDNQRFEIEFLETLRAEEVERLIFVTPSDATLRWGTGYANGAIEVHTRRR